MDSTTRTALIICGVLLLITLVFFPVMHYWG